MLDVILLAAMWLVDETRSRQPVTRVVRVTLDTPWTAVDGVEEAADAVRRRFDLEPLDVVLQEVDLVRETTRVAVRFAVPPQQPTGASIAEEDLLDAR